MARIAAIPARTAVRALRPSTGWAILPALALVAACGGAEPAAATAPAPAGGAPATAPAPAEAAPKAGNADAKVKEIEAEGDDRYALKVELPDTVTAGQEATVKVRVVPKAPWHMNLDFPTSLKVDANADCGLAQNEFKKADAKQLDDAAAEFEVKFIPEGAGDKAFSGQFKFAVCQDDACSPVTEPVEWKVAVK
jgi:hypothetical protein